MRDEAIFLNGVWENVLQDILKLQKYLPEHIMYLQPYSSDRIVHLAEDPPSADDPVRLLMSITNDLPHVRYMCEIVGWNDKRALSGEKLRWLNRVIYSFQWTESGVFMTTDSGSECRNLLYVRRMIQLATPFSVGELVKTTDDIPMATTRASVGGWTYVKNPNDTWLAGYL